MRDQLHGKVALITGAARGLGRAAAELFAAEGASVVVADRVDGSDVVGTIRAAGGDASFVDLDISQDESVHRAVQHAVNVFGSLHVLHDDAGISPVDDGGPDRTTDETWASVLNVNVTGVARRCRHGIPAILESGGCSIINVASFVAPCRSGHARDRRSRTLNSTNMDDPPRNDDDGTAWRASSSTRVVR